MGCTPAQASRRITAMETAFEDAKVGGYNRLIASMTNHPKDRHVLAAAVRCGAHAIVTDNIRHFPPESVAPYDTEVLTPDEFLVRQLDVNLKLLQEKLEDQAIARKVSLDQLLGTLGRRAPRFVRLVREAAG